MSIMTTAELSSIINNEYQAGGDGATLRSVARAIALTLPDHERATFVDGVEMCGLWLDLNTAQA